MSRSRAVLASGFLALLAFCLLPAGGVSAEDRLEPVPADIAASYRNKIRPLFQKYCFDCHSGEAAEAGMDLERFQDEASLRNGRRVWERLVPLVESGTMPPEDHTPRPTAEERKRIAQWAKATVFHVDCDGPADPGRVTIRRLNRAEYNNTIRDLVGVDFEPAEDFPSDDVGYGFDNIGDVLSVQPLLMEKYLDAAEEIARKAVLVVDRNRVVRRESEELKKSDGAELRSFGVLLRKKGEVYRDFDFPVTGEYVLRVSAGTRQVGEDPTRMALRLDGETLKEFDVEGRRRGKSYEVRTKVRQGRHKLAAAFLNPYTDPEPEDPDRADRVLGVSSLEVVGPVEYAFEDLPEKHRRIVFVRPDEKTSVRQAATRILERFMKRAFRRPVKDEEVEKYIKLVELAVKREEPFEEGIRIALQGVLVSPYFLFRFEEHPQPENRDPTHTSLHRVNDYELASRLSYFLWSSMPDEELFALAEQGSLHKREVLAEQVERMLQDTRSRALTENFAGQWLNLRILEEVSPDPEKYPGFDDALRRDMRRETELLFETVQREDRSLLDLLDADFTFVNERLAEHYGLEEEIKGDEFRKVSLAGSDRAGVLTHASILTLTSETHRTSPVKRGKWILENILGTPPPDPPPNVPLLEETAKAAPDASLRKQLEIHRKNPTCASCHVLMDGLGFGFENFDAVGRWRESEAGQPVDASGELPGGEAFSGPLELVQVLKKREKQFGRCITEKMLTYALGRGLEYYDECTVESILWALEKDDYRFSTLIHEITRSRPFQMRRGEGGIQ